MMTTSELIEKLRQDVHLQPMAGRRGPQCCRCDRSVERAAMRDLSDGGIEITFRCHGAVETMTIKRIDLQRCFDVLDAFELLPKRVFLRNFARYSTTTKPVRRKL